MRVLQDAHISSINTASAQLFRDIKHINFASFTSTNTQKHSAIMFAKIALALFALSSTALAYSDK